MFANGGEGRGRVEPILYLTNTKKFCLFIVILVACPVMSPSINRNSIKGIDRSFELRCEIRLNRFVMTNWRLDNFFYFILKGQHHKISKKPIDAA
jgi:hypothetical protein